MVMRRVMRASGAESLNVAASIFMGQTEAPLTIRPYLPRMTESELMTVMTSGMAHISGGIMAAYILFGIEAQHLLTAVIMTAPGTLMMAKIFVPETEVPETMGTVKLEIERTDVNVIDAAGRGTGEGLALALNVGAMLISFLALVALVNALLGLAGLSLQQIFGWVFAPIAWSMGVPWRDAPTIGNLLGTRMALNEFVAYSQLGPMKAIARSALVHDRDVRAVRLRQLQLDRHSDRRHRRAGADPAARPRPARPARDARRHARELHHRHHRRVPAMTRCTYARVAERAAAVPPRSAIGDAARRRRSCSARGSATSPTSLRDATTIPYGEIPHWPASAVVGHAGKLVVGALAGKRVAALSGRAHFYEGHRCRSATFATRVLGLLGVRTLILTNAAGGINLTFKPGTLMVIDDHINLMGSNPLVGAERRSVRPALSRHDRGVFEAAAAARRRGRARARPRARARRLRGVHGPSYETPAEIRLPADDRRRRGRHVDGARSHRRAPHGHGGARDLVHHQPGGRRSAAAARARRSDGSGAPRPRRVLALLEGIIERL